MLKIGLQRNVASRFFLLSIIFNKSLWHLKWKN